MTATTPEAIRASLGSLPALPGIVVEILEILNDEDASMSALWRLLEREPLIAARVFAAANTSSRYSKASGVQGIYAAALFIGMQRIREIVLTVSLADFSFKAGGSMGYWQHSLAASLCAQELGRQIHFNPEYALVAGLLHDLGKLWMAHCQPHDHARALRLAQEQNLPCCQAERAVFGLDHCQIGQVMAKAWGLPDDICAAIAQHHGQAPEGFGKLAALTHVAEVLSNGLDLPYRETNIVGEISEQALEIIGLDPESDLEDMLGRMDARFQYANARMPGRP